MKNRLKNAIDSKNEQELINFLDIRSKEKIDHDCYDSIEIALLGTWHNQHEDLVNTIYLESLIDDRFIDPIINIALNKALFRPYDDELEATLRKCVHALKTINSEKSIQALKKLEALNNENVTEVLSMYK
jgi:hypothetical protein